MEKTEPRSGQKTVANLQHLLSLHVPIIVKLSDKKTPLKEISEMVAGTIIEFDKEAEEELTLMVHNKPIGFGVVVKVGEHFGLRITSICNLRETISALGQE